jgi:hypothetical protein
MARNASAPPAARDTNQFTTRLMIHSLVLITDTRFILLMRCRTINAEIAADRATLNTQIA